MRSARLSAARCGSMLALALTSAAWPATGLDGQSRSGRGAYNGAILVQAVDTSINPLAAEIVLPAFGVGVRLSDEGVVLLMNIPDGTYLVQARHIGHRPEWRVIRITGDTARLDFVLAPADLTRGHVGYALAESRLRDFLRRSVDMQQGSFVTRTEIERRRPRNLAALLKRLPEITVDQNSAGTTIVRSGRAALSQCSAGMLLFVDGMLPSSPAVESSPGGTGGTELERRPARGLRPERVTFTGGMGGSGSESRWPTASARDLAGAESLVSSGPTSTRRNASPLDWVPISLVAGIEIYPTMADVPPEFRVAGAECGAVLVWTVRR